MPRDGDGPPRTSECPDRALRADGGNGTSSSVRLAFDAAQCYRDVLSDAHSATDPKANSQISRSLSFSRWRSLDGPFSPQGYRALPFAFSPSATRRRIASDRVTPWSASAAANNFLGKG